jgi:mono/diheme cytochrome c family protein
VKKILVGIVVVLGIALVGFALFVAARQNLRFEAPFPSVVASADSAVVARGRYVVRDVAVCASCHGAPRLRASHATGADVPLSGGFEWWIPPGRIYARNITPDRATGIGDFTDGAIARALRHGVGHDGRALLPFMEMQGLSDDDLVAVVSYLRAQPPVENPVPAHQYSLLGKIVKATVLANPVGPKETPPRTAPRGATVENGRYLAGSVALCWACHTERSQETGALTGPMYAGAKLFTEPDDPGRIWAPPNLTSAPETGRLARFSEDAFVERFRAGRLIPGSPMPWQAYARMSDEDLRAIYRYLKTLPPVENDVGPAFRPAKTSAKSG